MHHQPQYGFAARAIRAGRRPDPESAVWAGAGWFQAGPTDDEAVGLDALVISSQRRASV